MSTEEQVAALADEITAKAAQIKALLGAEPAPEPEPGGGVELTVTRLGRRARMDWTTTRTDITGWTVARDGTDTHGTGPWSTQLPAPARTFTMDLLRDGHDYVFTLTGHTAAGDLQPVTATTPGDAPDPGPDPEPDPDPDPEPGEDGPTAAALLDWGAPHPISDEFGYIGPPDPAKWQLPSGDGWPGHAGNGRRVAECVTVRDGMMILTGRANGDTGWVRQRLDVRHGRWEIRSRSRNTGSSGGKYHPLHLLWARNGHGGDHPFPQGGEYDWLEYFDPDSQKASAFLHYPHDPGKTQQEYVETPCDMTQWHNFAFEWTPEHLRGWIDGQPWYRLSGGATSTRRNIQDMPLGALTIQLDNFTGDGGLRPAVFEVAWVRFYPLGGA